MFFNVEKNGVVVFVAQEELTLASCSSNGGIALVGTFFPVVSFLFLGLVMFVRLDCHHECGSKVAVASSATEMPWGNIIFVSPAFKISRCAR